MTFCLHLMPKTQDKLDLCSPAVLYDTLKNINNLIKKKLGWNPNMKLKVYLLMVFCIFCSVTLMLDRAALSTALARSLESPPSTQEP